MKKEVKKVVSVIAFCFVFGCAGKVATIASHAEEPMLNSLEIEAQSVYGDSVAEEHIHTWKFSSEYAGYINGGEMCDASITCEDEQCNSCGYVHLEVKLLDDKESYNISFYESGYNRLTDSNITKDSIRYAKYDEESRSYIDLDAAPKNGEGGSYKAYIMLVDGNKAEVSFRLNQRAEHHFTYNITTTKETGWNDTTTIVCVDAVCEDEVCPKTYEGALTMSLSCPKNDLIYNDTVDRFTINVNDRLFKELTGNSASLKYAKLIGNEWVDVDEDTIKNSEGTFKAYIELSDEQKAEIVFTCSHSLNIKEEWSKIDKRAEEGYVKNICRVTASCMSCSDVPDDVYVDLAAYVYNDNSVRLTLENVEAFNQATGLNLSDEDIQCFSNDALLKKEPGVYSAYFILPGYRSFWVDFTISAGEHEHDTRYEYSYNVKDYEHTIHVVSKCNVSGCDSWEDVYFDFRVCCDENGIQYAYLDNIQEFNKLTGNSLSDDDIVFTLRDPWDGSVYHGTSEIVKPESVGSVYAQIPFNGSTLDVSFFKSNAEGYVIPPMDVEYDDGKVSWSAVTGATSYKVYKVVNGKTYSATTTDTEYTFQYKPKNGSIVYVEAIGEFNKRKSVELTVENRVSAPTNLVYKDNKLTWDAVDDVSSYLVVCDYYSVYTNSTEYTFDEGLPDGTAVYVIAVGSINNAESETIIVRNSVKAPENVSYFNGTVTWEAAENATSYKVYKVVNGKTYSATTTDTEYTFQYKPTDGSIVYVVAVNEFSDAKSEEVIVHNPVVITAPTNIVYDYDTYTITWDAVKGAIGYVIDMSYNDEWYRIVETTETSYTFKEKPADGSVYYVGAIGELNDEWRSIEILAPVKAPTNVAYHNGTVTWDAVENATSYKVYKVVNGKTYSATTTDTEYTFQHKPSDGSTVYVVAVNDRNQEKSEEVIVRNPVVIGAPTNIVYDYDTYTVTWDAVEGAIGYVIEKAYNDKWYRVETTDTSYTFKYKPANGTMIYIGAIGELNDEWRNIEVLAPVKAPTNVAYYNGTVTWDAVENATSYKVYKVVNGKTYSATTTDTEYTFQYKPTDGSIVYVVAVNDRNQKKSEEVIVHNPVIVEAPANVVYDYNSGTVTWDVVEGATGYIVNKGFNDVWYSVEVTDTSYTFKYKPADGSVICVLAVGELNEAMSKGIEVIAPVKAPTNVAYNNGTVTWNAVKGAKSYMVYKVVNGKTYSVTTTDTKYTFQYKPTDGSTVYVVAVGEANEAKSAEVTV